MKEYERLPEFQELEERNQRHLNDLSNKLRGTKRRSRRSFFTIGIISSAFTLISLLQADYTINQLLQGRPIESIRQNPFPEGKIKTSKVVDKIIDPFIKIIHRPGLEAGYQIYRLAEKYYYGE